MKDQQSLNVTFEIMGTRARRFRAGCPVGLRRGHLGSQTGQARTGVRGWGAHPMPSAPSPWETLGLGQVWCLKLICCQ